MQDLPAFLLAGLALVGSPGPATLSIAATGAAFGQRRGLAYMAGILAGLAVVMAITAGGIGAALWAAPGAAPVVTVAAAAYFVWLAWRIATAPTLGDLGAGRRPPTFVAGIVLSLLNPKGYAAMAALFSGFTLNAAHPVLDAALKSVLLLALLVPVDLAWLYAGAALTRHFRDPWRNRAINIGFAVLLLASLTATLLF